MPRNVLLIQDDPVDAKSVQEALTQSSEGSFQLEWVTSCSAALERPAREEETTSGCIVAILVDLFLPDSQGIETFDRLFRAAPHVRILLNDRLAYAIALAHRHRQRLAVLFLDVDCFKHVNDSLGHDIGDRLLQSVARRLLACVRTSDTVSRQGGDEFVILLSEVEHAQDAGVTAAKTWLAHTVCWPHYGRLIGREFEILRRARLTI